ncbi:DUF2971 domain-containing protein [Desulfolithobacter sp.]
MRVYHLLSAEFGISDIALSRIKIARYDDLNDPFELLAGEISERELRNAVSAMKKDFNETKGLVSFSRSWENPVLWSHYAEKHHGMALGFDIPDKYASEVHYRPDRIPVKYVDDNPNNGIEPSYVGEITSTKYKHWEYEDEIRLHVGLDEGTCEGGLYFLPFSEELELREVILGHSCPIPIDQVKMLLKKLHPRAKAVKARLAFKAFRVVADQRYVEK